MASEQGSAPRITSIYIDVIKNKKVAIYIDVITVPFPDAKNDNVVSIYIDVTTLPFLAVDTVIMHLYILM